MERGQKIREKGKFSTKDFIKQIKSDYAIQSIRYKPTTFIKPSNAFCECVNFMGFEESGLHAIVGKSDVGKTTLYLELIVDAINNGVVPVLINTEDKFNWERAKLVGLEFEQIPIVDDETKQIVGYNYEGDFIYVDKNFLRERYKDVNDFGVCYENAMNFMVELMNEQKSLEKKYGNAPSYAFFIDSFNRLQPSVYLKGFINKDKTYKELDELKTNNMQKTQHMNNILTNIVDEHIKSTLTTSTTYKNTMFIILQVYAKQMMQIKTVEINGGTKIRYICDSILYMGGKAGEGSRKITKTVGGVEYVVASQVNVEMEKSHSSTGGNGSTSTGSGTVYITAKGFINPKEIDNFKKENKNLFKKVELPTYEEEAVNDEEIENGIF